MSYPTTVAEEGIKIIRHHDKAYEVPTRLMRWGGVLKDIDQLGRYIFDEDLGMADECCNLVWQKQTRETSGFANAWPAKLASGNKAGTVAAPGGGNGGGPSAPRAGAIFTDPPTGTDANQATYGFRPSGNTGSQAFGPQNPAAGPVFRDPAPQPDANSPAHGGFGRPTGGDSSSPSGGGGSSGGSVGGQDPNGPSGAGGVGGRPPVATPERKNNCGTMSGKHTMLPVYDDTWAEDKRFKATEVKLPDKFPKMPKGLYGIALSGTYEYEQTPLFFPTDPRLFAVNYAGDAKMGTLVCDLNSDFEVDPDRTAPLQSAFRVVKKPLGGANVIAVQLGPSGCGDAEGGYIYDVGSAGGGPAPAPTGGTGQPGVASGGGGVSVGGGGQDFAPTVGGGTVAADGGGGGQGGGNFVIALLSTNKGGFVDVGSEDDVHHVGADGDGTKINKAHINTKGLFRKNFIEDGPLRFEDAYHEGKDLEQFVKVHLAWSGVDWAWWTTGPLKTVDPQYPNIREDPKYPVIPLKPNFPDRPNISTGNIGGGTTGGGPGGGGKKGGVPGGVISVDRFIPYQPPDIENAGPGADIANPASGGPAGGPPPTPPYKPPADGPEPGMPWSPSIEDLLKSNGFKNLGNSSTGFNGFPTNVAFGQSFQGSNLPLASAMTLAQSGSWSSAAMSTGKPQTANPISGAMSSFGAMGGQTNPAGCGGGPSTAGAAGDPWVYTDVPGNSRFGPGTTSGGWIVHPPETTPADQELYGMVPPNKSLSTTYFMTAPGAYFAAGTPQMAIGGVTSGWSWGMDSATGDLVWRTHVQGVATTGMRFILASQNFAWYSGTSYEGIFEHANTGNRTYTVPDLTASVELFQVTSSSPNGALTGIIGTLAWDNVNHQLYVNTDNATAWSLAGGAAGVAGPPGPAGATVPVIVSGTTNAGYGLEAHGKTVADGSSFYPGGLAPVANTDIGFTLLVPGSVTMAYTLTWNSGTDTFPALLSGLYVDGTFYYLGISYEVQGSGSDTTLGFAHTGTLTLPLAAGNHTVQIGASGDGRMYIMNSAASPTTISVLVPTPLSVNVPAQTLPDSITTMVAGQFIVMDDWLPTPMSRRLVVDTNVLTLADGGPGNFVMLGLRAMADGQVLIGSGGTANVASTLTAGSNVTITNGPGTITISSTGGGGGLTASGPPVANQVAFWTSATNLTGDVGMTYAAGGSLSVGKQFIGPGLFNTAFVDYAFAAALNTGLMGGGDGTNGETDIVVSGVKMVSAAIDPTGTLVTFLTPANTTAKSPFRFTPGAQTAVTAGTEVSAVLFDAHAVQHNTGAVVNQRTYLFNAATYSFVAASTVTTAATVYIADAPQVGANATFTNSYALWVASGITLLTTLNLTNALTYPYGGTGLTALGTPLQVLRTNAGGTAMEWATATGGPSLPASDSTGYKFLRDDSTWADPGFGSVLTVDAASSFPLGRQLLTDNTLTGVDAGPGSIFFMGVNPAVVPLGTGVSGQVSIWSTDVNGNPTHVGDSGLIYSTTNQSVGIGSSVSVAAAETLSVIGTETVVASAAATWNAVHFQASTATLNGTTSVTTAAGFDYVAIDQPTIARVSGSVTVTNAATVYIANSPAAGTGVTITNAYALWVAGGQSRFVGPVNVVVASGAVTPFQVSGSTNAVSVVSFTLPSYAGGTTSGVLISQSGTSAGTNRYLRIAAGGASSGGVNTFVVIDGSPAAATGGVHSYLSIIGGANTGQTTGTEINFVSFNLAQTVTWAAGAITNQRCFYIQAPTLAFASASTITNAATMCISGAPATGASATLTNSYAVWVAGDISRFDGAIQCTAIAAPGTQTAGNVWYDSTQKTLQVYETGTVVSKNGCVFTATADVALNNSATETSMYGTGVGTQTLAANFLVAGKTIRIEVRGKYTTGATPQTLTIKFKLGTVVIASVAAFAPPISQTNTGFVMTATFTCRTTGASGTVYGQGDCEFESGLVGVVSKAFAVATAAQTVDTTVTEKVDVTITTALADAGATYTSTTGVVEVDN